MTLKQEVSKFLKHKQLEWHQEQIERNPRAKMTQRAFSRWLGIPEQTLSDLMLADREPSPLQLYRISKRYPEIYEVIGRPDLADYGVIAERKQKRLARIMQMVPRISEPDMAVLEHTARSMVQSPDEPDESNQRPFEFVEAP